MTELLSPAEAAAHAARLAQAAVHFAPSALSSGMSAILNPLAMAEYESHQSALAAAMAASAAGRRVFVPLSIRSLDEFCSASFQRLPIVAANISRCTAVRSARSDMNDIMSLRDAGWMIFLAQNNQDVFDSILVAYRMSEDVMLPSIVNINMDVREPVAVPTEKKLLTFLNKPKIHDFKRIVAINPPVDDYAEFRAQQQAAMNSALVAAEKTFEKWKGKFGRAYSAVEKHMMDDADYAFVVAGFNALTCRSAVDALRARGERVGMLRIRMLRPFPAAAMTEAMKNVKKAAIVDESISLGSGGILSSETARCYSGFSCNYIALGKRMTERMFAEMFSHLKKAEARERVWI